jgi:hypothetical protein
MSHEPPTNTGTSPAPPSDAGPQFEGDEINAGLLTVIGAFLAVTVFLIVVLLQAWFYNWKADAAASQTVATNDPDSLLGRALVEQQEQINSYHWIQREANVRAIPVERAMQLVTAEMAAQQAAAQKAAGKEGAKP